MSRTYSVYEQNFAHFKFLSQHFHKSLAILADGPELKGIKAHDRFARLFGWETLNEVNQYLKGFDKRLQDFGSIKKEQITAVYADLYPDVAIRTLFDIYYDFFYFSHHNLRSRDLSFETLKQLKNITFFPKRPSWDMGQVADYFSVALESYSFMLKRERGFVARDMLNSAMMLYFDFYDKGLISDFTWQDIADLTHPHCYHDAFIKYKTQLKPKFEFISSASHCYDKIAFYTGYDKQVSDHENLCTFLSEITNIQITPQEDREKILFNRVYQEVLKDDIETVESPNSIEVNKDRVFTLNDFDFSKTKPSNHNPQESDDDSEDSLGVI